MKLVFNTFLMILIISCNSSKLHLKSIEDYKKYEKIYDTLTKNTNQKKPYLEDYKSDASGVKIVSRIFKIKDLNIYGTENFQIDNSYTNRIIKKLSKKHTQSNWRKDDEYKILNTDEVSNFHGPLFYIYFSEIRNDSVRADILGNPNAKYHLTHSEHYVIFFENNKIKTIKKWTADYD